MPSLPEQLKALANEYTIAASGEQAVLAIASIGARCWAHLDAIIAALEAAEREEPAP